MWCVTQQFPTNSCTEFVCENLSAFPNPSELPKHGDRQKLT